MIDDTENVLEYLARRNDLTVSRWGRDVFTGEPAYHVSDPFCSNMLLTPEFGISFDDAVEFIREWADDYAPVEM